MQLSQRIFKLAHISNRFFIITIQGKAYYNTIQKFQINYYQENDNYGYEVLCVMTAQ